MLTGGGYLIRIGDHHPRTVTLPTIGTVRLHDDTRRLRRLLRSVDSLQPDTGERVHTARAKILFATVSRHGTRWYVSLNVNAPDLHPGRRHPPRPAGEHGGWVGIDRGLSAFAVAATQDGVEVGRWAAPKPLVRRLGRLRRRSRDHSRTALGSRNRVKAAPDLSREHARIADARRSFLHEVSSQLAKTHGRLAIEDLAVANLARNRHLARAISDAGWAELGRQLSYKAGWFGAELVACDRWFASTKTCSRCGMTNKGLGLAERVFHCGVCGLAMDRDRNAAANLAAWAEAATTAAAQAPDRQAGGRVIDAPGGEGTGRHLGDGATGLIEGGTATRATTVLVKDTRGGWRASTSSGLLDAL